MKNLYSKILFLFFCSVQYLSGMDTVVNPVIYGEVRINPLREMCVATKYYYQNVLNKRENSKHIYEPLVPVFIDIFDDQKEKKNPKYNALKAIQISESQEVTTPRYLVMSKLLGCREGNKINVKLKGCVLELEIKNLSDASGDVFEKLLNRQLDDFEIKPEVMAYPRLFRAGIPKGCSQEDELIEAGIIKIKDGELKFVKGPREIINIVWLNKFGGILLNFLNKNNTSNTKKTVSSDVNKKADVIEGNSEQKSDKKDGDKKVNNDSNKNRSWFLRPLFVAFSLTAIVASLVVIYKAW